MRDPWLPIGFRLSSQAVAGPVQDAGQDWQIIGTTPHAGKALLVTPGLAERWSQDGYLDAELLEDIQFGTNRWKVLWGGANHQLVWVPNAPSPETKSEALSFAMALRRTREISQTIPFGDAIFVERYSLLLPTFSSGTPTPDDLLLGRFLTGGVEVSCLNLRRMEVLLGWMPPRSTREVIQAAAVGEFSQSPPAGETTSGPREAFRLPGRPALEEFFQEYIIDIIQNEERYRALGIQFPAAVVLQGPPGCGKTYAVQRLIDYLSWPSFEIESASIGSPYIHETGRKISDIFDQAKDSAPCAVVMDEMEAFLSGRDISVQSHHLEEVAEFLRRIPEARNDRVLVFGMTNRIDLIDQALLRRGRFDHIIEVGPATPEEIEAVLADLLSPLPHDRQLPLSNLAKQLDGCPLSDVAFIVREAARLSAKAKLVSIETEQLRLALERALSRTKATSPKGIGFLPV